jgi:hypothetical protein
VEKKSAAPLGKDVITPSEVLFSQINANTKGAPGYPPLTMFKIILLQQWYSLSDPAGLFSSADFEGRLGIPGGENV